MANPIRTVVVGYGYAGQRIHLPLVRLAPQLCLHGILSGDPVKRETIRQMLGCRTYETLDQVCADGEVDLVILATPNDLHCPQAIAAMKAGKHVVVDKPMCLSAEEGRAMIAASHACRRVLSIFHNRRLDGDYLTLRDLIQQGALGDVRWLEMAWQRRGLPRTWKQKAQAGGGRLLDLGSHLVDQCLQLFPGPVKGVYCRMHRDWPGVDVESHAMLTLSFADGRTAIADTGSMTYAPKPRFLAVGSEATFVKYGMDPQEAALAAGNIDAAREVPSEWGQIHESSGARPVETLPGQWRRYYENLGQVLQTSDPYGGRGELLVRPEEVLRTVAVLEAARQSAEQGAVVSLDV